MNTKTAALRTLRRRQLDRRVADLAGLRQVPAPQRGWIAEVRLALGMSSRQLAHRLGVTQPSVSDLEESERHGGISLNSLRKAGDAMDCDLVYVFLPREPFERIVRNRARAVASRIVDRIDHSMRLEDQGTGAVEREEALVELADELARTLDRTLWEPWD